MRQLRRWSPAVALVALLVALLSWVFSDPPSLIVTLTGIPIRIFPVSGLTASQWALPDDVDPATYIRTTPISPEPALPAAMFPGTTGYIRFDVVNLDGTAQVNVTGFYLTILDYRECPDVSNIYVSTREMGDGEVENRLSLELMVDQRVYGYDPESLLAEPPEVVRASFAPEEGREVEFFRLRPKESESFRLEVLFATPGYYKFQGQVEYRYQGQARTAALPGVYEVVVPNGYRVWTYDYWSQRVVGSDLQYDIATGQVRAATREALDAHALCSDSEVYFLSRMLDFQHPELYVVKGGGIEIVRVRGSQAILGADLWPFENVHQASFSPASGLVALCVDEGLKVLDLVRQEVKAERKGAIRWPSWSGDGEEIAFEEHTGGQVRVVRYVVETGFSETLSAENVEGYYPRWSPSTDAISYVSESDGHRALHVVDLSTHQDTEIARVSGDVKLAAWSPDGEALAYTTSGGLPPPFCDLFVYSLGDRSTTLVHETAEYRGDESRLEAELAWSPDGRLLAFLSEGGILLWDVQTHGTSRLPIRGTPLAIMWALEGPRVAYVSEGANGGDQAIWGYDLNTLEDSQMLACSNCQIQPLLWICR